MEPLRGEARRSLLRAVTTASLLALVGSAAAETPGLTVDQVDALRTAPDVRIFDVNNRDVYEKGHVPGALFGEARAIEKALPADRALRLVFYCKNSH